MKERDQIDRAPTTINLKNRLYEIRNDILDYLVANEPDQKINDLLAEGDLAIKRWAAVFSDYLVTDDEYYTKVAHRILEPAYVTLNYRNGDYDELEEEIDVLLEEHNKLKQQVQTNVEI